MGSRTLSRWIQMPLIKLEMIKRRLDAVEELLDTPRCEAAWREGLKGASDLERLVSRVSCSAANPKDLLSLKNTLQRLPACKRPWRMPHRLI